MNIKEKSLFDENPEFAQIAISEAYTVAEITMLLFSSRPGYNDHSDALRHCLWSAVIAHKTTIKWSMRWTTAHEEVDESIDEDDTKIGHKMDLFNNSIGISIVKNYPGAKLSFIINECINNLKNGKLKIIKNDQLVPSSDPGSFLFNIMEVILKKNDNIF